MLIGHHFASEAGAAAPEWQTLDGTYAVGRKVLAYTPDGGSGSIPWLLLGATSTGGSGTLSGTTYVQRLNTAGGNAPCTGCDQGALGTIQKAPVRGGSRLLRPVTRHGLRPGRRGLGDLGAGDAIEAEVAALARVEVDRVEAGLVPVHDDRLDAHSRVDSAESPSTYVMRRLRCSNHARSIASRTAFLQGRAGTPRKESSLRRVSSSRWADLESAARTLSSPTRACR